MTTKIPAELSSTPGISDSSDATAITINSSENVKFENVVGINKDVNTAVALSVGADATSTTSYGLEITNSTANTRFLVDGEGSSIFYKTNNAEGMRFNATSGNLKFASGQGIDFSDTNDGSGSMSSEVLDDYEEGTWTPTLPNGGTLNNNYASVYTKIGRFIHAYCYVNVTATNNSSIFQIGGLPYNGASISNFYGGGSLGYTDTLDVSSWSAPLIHPLNNFLYFHFNTSSTSTVLNSHLGGVSRYLMINMTYKTD
tara:strand:- start:62 stop:829 length:768 start_codon:yes stop_codon:yes gene_type:complete